MHQMIYVSEAAPDLDSAEIFRIIEQSARNNPTADITGFLILRDRRFLQLIEGPRMSLDGLLAVLARDPRHHSLRVLSCLPIITRAFGAWRMRRIGSEGDAGNVLEQTLIAESGVRQLPAAVRDFLRVGVAA